MEIVREKQNRTTQPRKEPSKPLKTFWVLIQPQWPSEYHGLYRWRLQVTSRKIAKIQKTNTQFEAMQSVFTPRILNQTTKTQWFGTYILNGSKPTNPSTYHLHFRSLWVLVWIMMDETWTSNLTHVPSTCTNMAWPCPMAGSCRETNAGRFVEAHVDLQIAVSYTHLTLPTKLEV